MIVEANSDIRNESSFDSELNPDFWREYVEEKEHTRQLADEAFVEDFCKFKVFER